MVCIGSAHPAHVHSDSILTGTYYSSSPKGAAPLLIEGMIHISGHSKAQSALRLDPRGRSPFDVMMSLESQLRYGKGVGGSVEPIAPFNRPYTVEPTPGRLVLFPGL